MSTSRNTMNMGRFITYLTILTKAMGRSITHNRKTMGKSITQLWTNPLHILENLLEGQMLITITMGRSSSHSRNHWQVHYPKKCRGRPITPHRKNYGHVITEKKLWADTLHIMEKLWAGPLHIMEKLWAKPYEYGF